MARLKPVSPARNSPRGMVLRCAALALALVAAVLAGAAGSGAAAADTVPAAPVLVTGLDLHDGTVITSGTTLYMLGTRYACGFNWDHTSPWCGFGSASATALSPPAWSAPVPLFSPGTRIEASGWTKDNGRTWNSVCGTGGAGCFNPRMVQAPGGQWLLWFNATGDKARHANPYWVMTCSGPQGPCGAPHKPAIYGCNNGGDFSIAVQGGIAWMICSGTGRIITLERLGPGDRNGVNTWHDLISRGAAGNTGLGGSGPAEGVGIGILHVATGYEAVWSQPNCGYCSGPPLLKAAAPGATEVQAGYATAASLSGPWTYRGLLSPDYCTGQPRTVFGAAGASWEWVDHWNGTGKEAGAAVAMIPLEMTPWSCQ
jgi:hypothetical protein